MNRIEEKPHPMPMKYHRWKSATPKRSHLVSRKAIASLPTMTARVPINVAGMKCSYFQTK